MLLNTFNRLFYVILKHLREIPESHFTNEKTKKIHEAEFLAWGHEGMGDSAESSSLQSPDPKTQALLPPRTSEQLS